MAEPVRARPRVLLADDYAPLLGALRRLLEPCCDVIGEVADGVELLRAALDQHPEVAVVDLRLPEISGLEFCRRIQETRPEIRVIVLTADEDEQIKQEALTAGAADYIPKRQIIERLVPAVLRAAHRLPTAHE